ncbi:protein of unknown function [Nitrosospira sp. Nl5]|uniref:eCIS core domain-containing protein n=1 Tax=Nitrosospira sp. Nl5 TaxID=200120 RepID=UPI0008876A39|nr:DUF4157 domain-containing protein [Nitrosospira sp. Nl5]SCX85438.1 protein of unknown function [Nitrosospira sp. Nl5]
MSAQLLTGSPEKSTQQVRRLAPGPLPASSFRAVLQSPILQLQRTLGNRRVAQLIQASRLTPQGRIIGVQPKLTVGAADDQYEQEADRVARQVMSMPDPASGTSIQPALAPEEKPEEDKDKILQSKPLAAGITPLVQRQMENTEESEDKEMPLQAKLGQREHGLVRRQSIPEEEVEPIQAKSGGSWGDSFEAGDEVESKLNSSKGSGGQLPDTVRTYMEPRFGMDFGHVRVHTGSAAIQMNRNIGAQAFTHGSDIFFGAESSPHNLELTAHELTHVVQQSGAMPLPANRLPQAATGNTNLSMQRACPACGAAPDKNKGEDTEADSSSCPDFKSSPKIARQHIAKTGARLNNHWQSAQRQSVVSGEEEKEKISTARLNQSQSRSLPIQRKTHRGEDGSDYVELTIPDGTYVLEAANIPAEAYWGLTYTNYADVYATASQFLPKVIDGLNANPHTLRHTDKGVKPEHNFRIKPGAELDPEAGLGSAKVQGFRHGYISDDPVIEAYLQFDTVPLLENPRPEEHVANNIIDMNPEHHEAFSCPEQGKMQLQKETSVTVTDGVALSETKTVGNTLGFEISGEIGKKDSWKVGGKVGYQRSWGKSLGKTVTEQKAVTKKLQVSYTCEGAGDWAFVPTCSVWRTPLTVNVSDKTGKRTGQDIAYLYRVKYNPDARVCKVVNGKVDPNCGKTAATETAAAVKKPVLDMTPDEFEKNQEAQYQLFTMAKSCRSRMQALADDILAQQLIKGEAKSILKRDSFPEFVKGVVAKCRRNGYNRIGQMDDIVRGRFNLRSNEDVNTVAAALKVQKKYPVSFVVGPQREQPGGGFGYPRWHIILSDPESGLTHEWQIGTQAVTDVFEKGKIKLPDGVELGPDMKPNLHDIEYDIFRGIEKKYPDVHKRHNLPEFHAKVDALAAEAGLKGEKTPDLAKKIGVLHKDAYLHLQKLVDEFGPEWLKQFYH